ncbi:hypothetical protein FC52_GL001526 [Lactobacillus pasteurii DSM 23907 = CRBIP 24.76]|nr:hypothetical protein FC52_GL001526 [Lactobacillus pasteurii DSM 23907 = CRBIP 24.76]
MSLDKATSFTKYLAGAEVNVAVGLTRLNHTVDYVSVVGDDPFGQFLRDAIAEQKIDTKYLYTSSKYPTGCMFKSKTSTGDPITFYLRKGSAAAHLSKEIIDQIELAGVKWAHITGILPGILETPDVIFHLLERLKKANVSISFDPNLRPAVWPSQEIMIETINNLAKSAKMIMPGVKEGAILTGETEPRAIADKFFSQSEITETVVIKMGPEGAMIFRRGQADAPIISGFKVDHVVDTVGAGDGFAVGLLSGILEGKSLEEAVSRGNAIGAMAVMSPGDNDGYPDPSMLDKFLKEAEN